MLYELDLNFIGNSSISPNLKVNLYSTARTWLPNVCMFFWCTFPGDKGYTFESHNVLTSASRLIFSYALTCAIYGIKPVSQVTLSKTKLHRRKSDLVLNVLEYLDLFSEIPVDH